MVGTRVLVANTKLDLFVAQSTQVRLFAHKTPGGRPVPKERGGAPGHGRRAGRRLARASAAAGGRAGEAEARQRHRTTAGGAQWPLGEGFLLVHTHTQIYIYTNIYIYIYM